MQTRVLNLPWTIDVDNREWKKRQMNWQVSFHVGSEETLIEEYVLLAREGTCWRKAPHGWVGGFAEAHLGLDPNKEPKEGNDTDDHPTPTTKLPQARERAQLLSNYAPEHSSKFLKIDANNMQSLNKVPFSNINKYHHKTTYSYLCSVWYGDDIIMGIYTTIWLCEHISLQ
jgi:hypothetical protein